MGGDFIPFFAINYFAELIGYWLSSLVRGK
jgi:hypothetical protein